MNAEFGQDGISLIVAKILSDYDVTIISIAFHVPICNLDNAIKTADFIEKKYFK